MSELAKLVSFFIWFRFGTNAHLADQLLGIGSLTADHGVNIADLDFNILHFKIKSKC